jgi:antitoxin (DNA-binding transcriptional repressor) of toxin-antitoxin stability system
MRGRKPVARLAPLESRTSRELGFDKGTVKVAADFDAPLPEDVLRDFEG